MSNGIKISARMLEMSDKVKAVGSKAEVFHGTAKHTSGGLKKKDLMKHHGRIISRKKHAAGKKAIKHLFAAGYKPKKGTFKLMRKSMAHSSKRHSKRSKRHTRRGGAVIYSSFMDGPKASTNGSVSPTAASTAGYAMQHSK
jgi:hypothetical protein